jgi:uncharacterized protein (TIGR02246 family)
MQQAIRNILFPLFMLFISQGFAESFPPSQEEKIRAVLESHYTAWNQHDPKKMANLYAPDGDLRTVFNEWAKNRNEIEKIYADEQNTKLKNAHIHHKIKSIRMVKPDIAFVDVESDIEGMETLDKKKYMPLHHHVIFVLVQKDGQWQILIGRPF